MGTIGMLANGLAAVEEYNRLLWQGQLKIALFATKGRIQVHVIKARYLQLDPDSHNTIYVQVRVASRNAPMNESQLLRSKVIPYSESAIFDEKFSFLVRSHRSGTRLFIELFRTNKMLSDTESVFLGGMSFDVGRLHFKSSVKPLECYNPESSKAHCRITHSATNLTLIEKEKPRTHCEQRTNRHSLSGGSQDDLTDPKWYYLFDKKNSLRHHKLAYQSGQNAHSKLDASTNVPVPNYLIDFGQHPEYDTNDNVSTISSVSNGKKSQTSEGDVLISHFTIPHSNSGYGFTLMIQPEPTKPLLVLHNHGSNVNTKLIHSIPNITVQAVKQGSPADKVGLPIGCYLIEVDDKRLESGISLKQAVKRIRYAARKDPAKAIKLGIVMPCDLPLFDQSEFPSNCVRDASGMLDTDDVSICSSVPGLSGCEINGTKTDNWLSSIAQNGSLRSVSSVKSMFDYIHRSGMRKGDLQHDKISQCSNTSLLSNYGSTFVCEEICIDSGQVSDSESVHSRDGSWRRRRRMLTLAHPVLNLQWSDVSSEEAKRQWAIADLLSDVSDIADNLVEGTRVYKRGLTKVLDKDTAEINALFANITEITCKTWRLFHRLKSTALPYTSTHGSLKSCKETTKFTVSMDVRNMTQPVIKSNKAEKKSNLFTRLKKSISVNAVSRTNSCMDSNGTLPTRNGKFPHVDDNMRQHRFPSHSVDRIPPTPVQRRNKSANNSSQLASDDAIELENKLKSPPHGHLDIPGTIVLEYLRPLLPDCALYAKSYLSRLKAMQELRSQHMVLRTYMRNQTMTDGVPSLTKFLSLPFEISRVLLSNLRKIEAHTGMQHNDRIALEECLQLLSESAINRGGFNGAQSNRNSSASRSSAGPSIFNNGAFEFTNDQRTFNRNSSSNYIDLNNIAGLKNSPQIDSQSDLVIITRSTRAPVLSFLVKDIVFDPASWNAHNRYIVFQGSLKLLLQSTSKEPSPSLYSGAAYAYLLNDALLLMTDEDNGSHSVNQSKPSLICEPVMLSSVEDGLIDEGGTQIQLNLITGHVMTLTCDRLEDAIVWKTLINQRISLVQDRHV